MNSLKWSIEIYVHINFLWGFLGFIKILTGLCDLKVNDNCCALGWRLGMVSLYIPFDIKGLQHTQLIQVT